MKVTHLYHSGCLIELEHHLLLFDYDQGELHLNPHKPLYIFVSHQHDDHYNPAIFQIQHDKITYIFSDTVPCHHQVHYLAANQTNRIDDLDIQTFLSTDEGCAFLVRIENRTIYHAGDLNWWHWEGEPQSDNDYQKKTYQQQIKLIQEKIDLACVVVDIRQEKDYLKGLAYFLKHVRSQYILPIHYFGHYETTQLLLSETLDNPYHAHILPVTHRNQTFEI